EGGIMVNAALLMCVFTVIALVLELPKRSLMWGIASIVTWLVATLGRILVDGVPEGIDSDLMPVNVVAPMLFLGVITWMLQLNTRHLYQAIRISEEARAEVERGHKRLAQTNTKLEETNHQVQLANVRLNEAREVAEAANKSKSQFLANMSHELRTPLNAILGYSEMLYEEASSASEVEDLRRIHHSGQHLLSLINDILDISKIESGRMELYLEEFELQNLVDDTLATAEPLFAKKNNSLSIDIGSNVGSMRADFTKVRQCLLNLLSNAAKFTADGTVTLQITRKTDDEANTWIVMAVTDTGIGMTEAQQAKIFEPFSQVDASTTRKFGGTGLGLAITSSFCEMMGGSITGDSKQGVGSTFTIRLPVEVQDLPDQDNDDDEDISGDPNQGLKLLVIDSDPTSRHLMRQHFGREGYFSVMASTWQKARERASAFSPDAIILDVELAPPDSGWEVLQQLRADATLGSVPVIVVTIADEKKRAFRLGATEYLLKPADRNQLIAAIRRSCDRTAASAPSA
ncbi:MAG: ATP-binding protein, partial [Nannocystaceae bacterium]